MFWFLFSEQSEQTSCAPEDHIKVERGICDQ